MGPIILRRKIAHHTATFKECSRLSWMVRGFSAPHILLFWLLTYPLRWNHASSLYLKCLYPLEWSV
jgi:hypothetical protein